MSQFMPIVAILLVSAQPQTLASEALGTLTHWAQPKYSDRYDAVADSECEDFLHSLSFVEMGMRQAVVEPAELGTCAWILKHPDYEAWTQHRWLDQSHGLLWIKGRPGSGKSTLMKYIVSNTSPDNGTIRLSFFFNARGAKEEHNAHGLFTTLLHQMGRESPTMRSRLVAYFRDKKSRLGNLSVNWTLSELHEMFFGTVQANNQIQVEVFIDAIDEFDEDEVRSLINGFERCAASLVERNPQKTLKICWSSRHYPHIIIQHGFEIVVEAMNTKDIARYVNGKFARRNVWRSLGVVEVEIVHKATGSFMWTVLVVNQVCKLADKGIPVERILEVVRDLPLQLNALYNQILASLDPELAEETNALVTVVLYAMRPLTVNEVRLAMKFIKQACPSSLQEIALLIENEQDVSGSLFQRFIMELSGGLIEVIHIDDSAASFTPTQEEAKSGISTTSGLVQVIHETVRDFFVRATDAHEPYCGKPIILHRCTGHLRIYRACARILATDELSCALSLLQQVDFLGLDEVPRFVDLANRWLAHSVVAYVRLHTFSHLQAAEVLDADFTTSGLWHSLQEDLKLELQRDRVAETVLRWRCLDSAILRPPVAPPPQFVHKFGCFRC